MSAEAWICEVGKSSMISGDDQLIFLLHDNEKSVRSRKYDKERARKVTAMYVLGELAGVRVGEEACLAQVRQLHVQIGGDCNITNVHGHPTSLV
jgi:hypothetical protein